VDEVPGAAYRAGSTAAGQVTGDWTVVLAIGPIPVTTPVIV
jgi:hypothetical protein